MATSLTLPAPSAPMTVTDTASMLSSIPADIFTSAPEMPEPASDDAPIEDTPVEAAPVEDEPAAAFEEPISDGKSEGAEDTTQVAGEAQPPAAEAPAAEDLPEGITKGKDSKGRTKYFLDENRYKTVYRNHQLVQQLTETLGGEPLTPESLDLRNQAYLAQERLFGNLTSGDPAAQGEVVDFILSEMATAHADGETGVDPSVPFAETIYSTLREKSPDAYAVLRMQAARDLVDEMYDTAARLNDTGLRNSMGHVARTLAGIGPKGADESPEQYLARVREGTGLSKISFYTPDEVMTLAKPEDPTAALARENALLKSQLNGRQTNTQAERFTDWNRSHIADTNKAVFNDAVKPALSSVEEAWKSFPDDYKRLVVDPLNSEVTKAVRADQVLNQQVKDLTSRAQRATSEQVRQQIGDQIKQLFVNRARLAADKAKAPILKFAADALKGRSAQTNERKTAAQTRTAPQGQGTPVKHSVLPDMAFKNGMFDRDTAMKQAMAALNGR